MTPAERDLADAEASVDRRCDELRQVWRKRDRYRRARVVRGMLALKDALGVAAAARREVQLEACRGR